MKGRTQHQEEEEEEETRQAFKFHNPNHYSLVRRYYFFFFLLLFRLSRRERPQRPVKEFLPPFPRTVRVRCLPLSI
jgi:hypothetical protein